MTFSSRSFEIHGCQNTMPGTLPATATYSTIPAELGKSLWISVGVEIRTEGDCRVVHNGRKSAGYLQTGAREGSVANTITLTLLNGGVNHVLP